MGLNEGQSLDQIADGLQRLATIAEAWFAKTYPEKKDVRDATITHVESQEEKDQRERLQGSESTTDEWRDLGPREREFLSKSK
jgi:hypothetical protein